MDLKRLIKEAHQTAVEHGWWDKENPFEDQIANMHAELSETWEDWRNRRGLNEFYYECKRDRNCSVDMPGCEKCKFSKPCGIPVELADVCIRIFDTLGKNEADQIIENINPGTVSNPAKSFSDFIAKCHFVLAKAGDDAIKYFPLGRLYGLIVFIENYCNGNGIELEKAIELKMAYNKLRSYRHGGKRV